MAVRPGQIRYLTEGKAVGAKTHKGFVATWNWVLSWIYNFKVGPGLQLTGERAGKPRLSLTLTNEDGAPIDDGGEETPYETVGEGGGTTGSFAYKGGVIGPGAVMVGRQAYLVNENGFDVSTTGGHDYRVKVSFTPGGTESLAITVEQGDGFEAPSSMTSYFPLYTIEDGVVTADYRGTFVVPVFEGGYY